MRVIETGLYRICGNKLIPFNFDNSNLYITDVRLKSYRFDRIDLHEHDGCVIDVFLGWHDTVINIYNTKKKVG